MVFPVVPSTMAWNWRFKGDGMAANPQAEIRGVCLPLNIDPIQQATELSLRGKDAAEPSDRGEIGMRKSVGAVKRRKARLVPLPGTELSATLNLPYGNRIRQRGLVSHRLAQSGVLQPESANIKNMGRLVGILHQHVQFGAIRDDLIHENSERAWTFFALRWVASSRAGELPPEAW